VLSPGSQVSFTNSFTGKMCSITSKCNGAFPPQPMLPGDLACCSFVVTPELWTVEQADEGAFRFMANNGDYLCAIADPQNGLWKGDMSAPHGFYLVTKTDLEEGCSYTVETVASGEVALRSHCGSNSGLYVGVNTAGFFGTAGEIPMCAIWDSIVNTGHTYRINTY